MFWPVKNFKISWDIPRCTKHVFLMMLNREKKDFFVFRDPPPEDCNFPADLLIYVFQNVNCNERLNYLRHENFKHSLKH